MTSVGLVLGRLYSAFGLDLHSSSSPVWPVRTGWSIGSEGQFDTGLVPVGKMYPYDSAGLEASPLQGNGIVVTFELYLIDHDGATDGESLYNVRQRYNTLYNRLMGTYTWGSTTGVSGQKGEIICFDERYPDVNTLYTATARALKPVPYKLTPGTPSELRVELPVALLSDFSVVSA